MLLMSVNLCTNTLMCNLTHTTEVPANNVLNSSLSVIYRNSGKPFRIEWSGGLSDRQDHKQVSTGTRGTTQDHGQHTVWHNTTLFQYGQHQGMLTLFVYAMRLLASE